MKELTFLFTDIENSTILWERHPIAMQVALARHDEILRRSISEYEGSVFKTMGDAFCAVFANAADALYAAVHAQHGLANEDWGDIGSVRVRMAIHRGVVEDRDSDYFGPTLNRVARLMAAGHGGQVLMSQTTADLMLKYGVGKMPKAPQAAGFVKLDLLQEAKRALGVK